MLRTGRFRHRLLDESFLQTHGLQGSTSLAPFIDLWRNKQLTDMEMAAAYILIFTFLRRPQDFLGGPHNLPLPEAKNGIPSAQVVALLRSTLPENLASAKSLLHLESSESFLPLFCSRSWRSVPFSVQRSLTSWNQGLYPLQLLTSIPTAHDVLSLQAQGRRCVSMLIHPKEITDFVGEGRDVLGFLIHDLIHADHFFYDRRKAQAQIEFCKKLLIVIKLDFIQEMLDQDEKFKEEFYYLMSDMNSVPLHLLKTLKALLLGFYKRQAPGGFKAALLHAKELEFKRRYEAVLSPWKFSILALEAAHRLNTEFYKHPEDSLILDHELSIQPG
ncbi:MAG: hypothetical protein ACM3MG_07640 [Bacillota bacterium]